jgi:hypothetical protein
VSRRAALVALATALATLAGCGVGEGERRAGGVELRITRDFGQELLASERVAEVREGETVIRLLGSRRKVTTRFGGGFVQSIDGLEGTSDGGRRDWFYFVNGREASVGAAEHEVRPGDVVQWDHRLWEGAMRVPAIVGAFPEPFVRGFGGKRRPVRVECADAEAPACGEVRRRLAGHDVKATGGKIGTTAGGETLRVVVGPWAALRGLATPRLLGMEPARSGVFARFAGERLELLDPRGRTVRAAPPGTGLVAATARGDELPVWIVTGLDEDGVLAAARALDPRALRDAFAVAATPAGVEKLPLEAG